MTVSDMLQILAPLTDYSRVIKSHQLHSKRTFRVQASVMMIVI